MRASPEKIEEILSYPTCNVEEAASVLGVARGTAYRMARDDGPNGLPVIRLGGQRVLVKTAALRRLIYEDSDHVLSR
jgi:excisionase family DNA binding protein